MFSDFPELLWCILPGAVIGIIVGYGLHLRYPEQMAENAQQMRAMPWWSYALFALMFAVLGAYSFLAGRGSFAIFFAGFALLQVAAGVMACCRQPSESAEN